MIENILKTLVEGLVNQPNEVQIETLSSDDKFVKLNIIVAKEDIGRVIGKEGKVANALSVILNSISYKTEPRKKYILKINEGQR